MDIKIKEIKRAMRHSALRPLGSLPPMRILGGNSDPEYNRESKVFHKKIVSGRVTLVDTQLTEENIKLHEKTYNQGSQDHKESEPKTDDFNEYFLTEPGG